MAAIASSAWIFPANSPKGTSLCSPSSIAIVKQGRRRRGDLGIRASLAGVPERPPDGDSETLDPLPAAAVPSGNGNSNIAAPSKAELALRRAKEYKKGKNSGTESSKPQLEKNKAPIAEAIAGSGSQILLKAGSEKSNRGESEGLRVSSIDFLGFDFSDKSRSRGIPAGLAPRVDLSFGGDSPEVEIIVGDMSKFGPSTSTSAEPDLSSSEENSDLYKPKVSTWGVFPRPKDISKTFGGGKTIRPGGEELQEPETKAMKEEYTKKLIAKYRNEIGLNVDPKIKAECDEAMEQGNQLMDAGRLREALPFFEKVMNALVFKSELHGLAALQWSICQDSLGRSEDARLVYDKLQSHPNVQVSKKAKQFMFGFQAMEMMKIGSSLSSGTTGYETYFDAFLPDKSNAISTALEEGNNSSFRQALPYLLLLISPIFVVLVAALRKVL